MRAPRRRPLTLGVLVCLALAAVAARASDWGYAPLTEAQVAAVRDAIAEMKTNPRGPYLRIRWFCEDGTVLPPGPSACAEHGGGHQHAEMRPEIERLGAWGFHFGTILQALEYESFADLDNSGYRLRELVLQDFLTRVDDGWVMRRARYYRGARQAEDEEARGRELLSRRLADRQWRQANPLLATLLVGAVPHGQEGVPGQRVRDLALQIAEADADFESLRVKLHSTPGPDDLPAVREHLRSHRTELSAETLARLAELIEALEATYRVAPDAARWQGLARGVGVEPLAGRLRAMPQRLAVAPTRERIRELSALLRDARDLLGQDLGASDGRSALAILDAVRYAGAVLFSEAAVWLSESPAASRTELLEVVGELVDATYGTGWLNGREREALHVTLDRVRPGSPPVDRAEYAQTIRYLASAADWATASLDQAFDPVIERYAPVEPVVLQFRDDAIRGSLLLPYSTLLQDLVADATRELGMAHDFFDREIRSGVIALNPGVAVGPLRFLRPTDDPESVDPDGIYVLPQTPPNLGRVAGIVTMDQGSRLSHVQLLARGLGIPNATVDSTLLSLLQQHEGQDVLYAVSSLGSVVMLREETTEDDEAFLRASAGDAGAPGLTIDRDRLDLETRRVLRLAEVDVQDSGRTIGPKAANLGRLHSLFPDRVAPGLVIPFGVFRAHVDRDLDGDGRTLYEEIVEIFAQERASTAAGQDPTGVQEEVYRRLDAVRRQIGAMSLLPEFRAELEAAMASRFGEAGSYGVFVRSDTNVEDLPGFSGAGLNLTVMNVIGLEPTLQAIRDVWASPFTRRSYQWRQRLIDNPESVYPSIVLLQSVPSEASGVLVTADITGITDAVADLPPEATWTVTVAKGIGGVVEGEAAETLLLPADADSPRQPILVSSARSPWQKMLGADGGGIVTVPAPDDVVLLTDARIDDLRRVVGEIVASYPRARGEDQPWDIEFGFVGDRTVLFQIRPFVTGQAITTLEAVDRLDRRILSAGDEPVDLSRRVVVGEGGDK